MTEDSCLTTLGILRDSRILKVRTFELEFVAPLSLLPPSPTRRTTKGSWYRGILTAVGDATFGDATTGGATGIEVLVVPALAAVVFNEFPMPMKEPLNMTIMQ